MNNQKQHQPLRVRSKGFPAVTGIGCDGRVQCDVCPSYCSSMRASAGSASYVTSGRRSAHHLRPLIGFCVDPIEKKPLNHFLPGPPSSRSAPRAAISHASSARTGTSKVARDRHLQSEGAPEASSHRTATGSRAIAYTYNDPVIFLEYAVDVAEAATRARHQECAVSAGYISTKRRAPSSLGDGRRQRRSEGFTDGFYRASAAASSHRSLRRWIRQAGDERLVRDHDAADRGRK